MSARWTARVARALAGELGSLSAEQLGDQVGVAIDGGLGVAAMAAILARPPGPARVFEASRWARRAFATTEHVAVVVPPGADEDWVDAHAELMFALHLERERPAS